MNRRAGLNGWQMGFLVGALAVFGGMAQSRILLKPSGKNAAPLRTKAVEAEVEIKNQFAHTRQVLTFQNEASDRVEADFVFTAPPHSVVTYFAYWYGEEKVVARVVEKDRAAQIYSYITSRMRDPALIELIGKDTFRARIFPIQPNADLKVEIQTVQTLPSAQGGAVYDYPLREMRGAAIKLESLDVKVSVHPDAEVSGVTNNYGVDVAAAEGGYSFAINQSNYRPPHDLQVRLERKTRDLHASLFAARSGGSTGFFALALTPDRDLKNPRLQLSGVRLLDKLPSRLPAMKAHRVYTLVGRYRGQGNANITLRDGAWRASRALRFSAARENNNIATRLWASRRIMALSASTRASWRRQKRVIALSKKWTLPSKYTSWLAIPQEERERYKDEKDAAERDVKLSATGRRLAIEIAKGREGSATARTLKRQLNRLARANGSNADYLLRQHLGEISNQIARAVVEEKYSSHPSAQRMASLKAQLNRAAAKRRNSYYYSASARLRDAEAGLKSEKISELAQQWLSEKFNSSPDPKRLEALRRKAASLKVENLDEASFNGKYEWARDEMNSVLAELVAELDKDEPNIKRVKELGARHRKIFEGTFRWEGTNVSTQVQDDIGALEEIEARRRSADADEREKIEEERFAKLEEMSRRQMEFGYGGGGGGDPLISVEAPADAAQVVAVMPTGELKQLAFNADSKKWEAHFDIPVNSAEGVWIITVIIVNNDGARHSLALRFGIDATPPQGEGRAQLTGDKSTRVLRLELDGGEDASRVVAIVPWGEKIELAPSAQKANRFFALAALPDEYSKRDIKVTFVLTDRAHNRTSIEVDLNDVANQNSKTENSQTEAETP